MDKTTAIRMFESLASGIRLDVYRLLVRQGEEGMFPGAIASTLDLPATTLSFHLKAMSHAGMVTVEQQGRYLRYRANIAQMLDMITFLTEECCAGQPGKCVELPAQSTGSAAVLPPIPATRANR